jgi:hypothetical protein
MSPDVICGTAGGGTVLVGETLNGIAKIAE